MDLPTFTFNLNQLEVT